MFFLDSFSCFFPFSYNPIYLQALLKVEVFFVPGDLLLILVNISVNHVLISEGLGVFGPDSHQVKFLLLYVFETQVLDDALVGGLLEELFQVLPVLEFLFLPLHRVEVCIHVDLLHGLAVQACCLSCRALGIPVIVHDLQEMLVLLNHLAVVTWMPHHQVLRKDYGAVVRSSNFL